MQNGSHVTPPTNTPPPRPGPLRRAARTPCSPAHVASACDPSPPRPQPHPRRPRQCAPRGKGRAQPPPPAPPTNTQLIHFPHALIHVPSAASPPPLPSPHTCTRAAHMRACERATHAHTHHPLNCLRSHMRTSKSNTQQMHMGFITHFRKKRTRTCARKHTHARALGSALLRLACWASPAPVGLLSKLYAHALVNKTHTRALARAHTHTHP